MSSPSFNMRFALLAVLSVACAFESPRSHLRRGVALYGETVRVKFRIHPDGRIEETVTGVKGSDCVKITEELNEKLGEVFPGVLIS